MVGIILAVIVLALVVYGIERNHARQSRPRPRLYGSTNHIDNRDTFRGSGVLSP